MMPGMLTDLSAPLRLPAAPTATLAVSQRPSRLRRTAHVLSGLTLSLLLGWGLGPGEAAAQATSPSGSAAESISLKPVTVASGLSNPWSLAFLPDGRMLVTERPGRLRIVSPQGQLSPPVAGLPPVMAAGQCGLLDVAVHPNFKADPWIYWSYAEGSRDDNGLAVARGRLDGNRVKDVAVIFRQQPKVASTAHCAGRLAFAPGGQLFITLGDRFSRKDDAPRTDNHLGKVVRLRDDGSLPADNPYLKQPGALPELFSIGHRNSQGAAIHPRTGELWTTEHGPQGGDELNIERAGRHYGWPVITFGRNYGTGTQIGEGTSAPGIEAPLQVWRPVSIAPSGLAFITSDRYPGWQGSLVMGALRGQSLLRLSLDGDRVTGEQRLLGTLNERIRDVRQGPDGWLYVLTDNADGQLLRLER